MSELPPQTSSPQPTPDNTDVAAVLPDFVAAPAAKSGLSGVIISGCMGGALLNLFLGFVLLGLQRSGIFVYGPGALAIIAGLLILLCVLREWPRRVLIGTGSVVLGMILTYVALRIFIEPILSPVTQSAPQIIKQSPPNSQQNGS